MSEDASWDNVDEAHIRKLEAERQDLIYQVETNYTRILELEKSERAYKEALAAVLRVLIPLVESEK